MPKTKPPTRRSTRYGNCTTIPHTSVLKTTAAEFEAERIRNRHDRSEAMEEAMRLYITMWRHTQKTKG